MMYALYQCYQQDKEEQQALDMLLAILQVDKNNENALSALAQFYADKEDGDALNKLIAQYQGTDAQKLLSQYEVQAPTVSETPGQYQRELQVSLFAEDSCTIYYTTDGTQPDSSSTQYTEAIALEGGITALKAVAVNTIGVYSPVAEFDYTINYQKPDAPVISPSSGTYEYGEKFPLMLQMARKFITQQTERHRQQIHRLIQSLFQCRKAILLYQLLQLMNMIW